MYVTYFCTRQGVCIFNDFFRSIYDFIIVFLKFVAPHCQFASWFFYRKQPSQWSVVCDKFELFAFFVWRLTRWAEVRTFVSYIWFQWSNVFLKHNSWSLPVRPISYRNDNKGTNICCSKIVSKIGYTRMRIKVFPGFYSVNWFEIL